MTWHARQALPRRLLRTASVLLAVVLSSSMAVAVGASEEIAEASARVQTFVDEGIRLFEKNDWAAAREQFLKAWELLKHYRIAANLAEVELKLGLYREAAEHLSFVLSHSPSSDVEAINVTRTQLDQCKEHVAILDIAVNEPGATVRVNGKAVGVSPLETDVFVDPGAVLVSAELPGFGIASRSLQARAGVHTSATLVLEKKRSERDRSQLVLPPPLAPRPQSSPAQEGQHGISTRTWALIGGSALTLIAGGVTAVYVVKYKSLQEDAKALREQAKREGDPILAAQDAQCGSSAGTTAPASCVALDDKLNERSSAARIANAGMAATAVLAGATLVTYVLWPLFEGEVPHASASGERSRELVFTPQLALGMVGVSISRGF